MPLSIKAFNPAEPLVYEGNTCLIPTELAQFDHYLATLPILTCQTDDQASLGLIRAVQTLIANAMIRTRFSAQERRPLPPADIYNQLATIFADIPSPRSPLSVAAIAAGHSPANASLPSVVCGTVSTIINASAVFNLKVHVTQSGCLPVDLLAAPASPGPLAHPMDAVRSHVLLTPLTVGMTRTMASPYQKIVTSLFALPQSLGVAVSVGGRAHVAVASAGSTLVAYDVHRKAPTPFTADPTRLRTTDLDPQIIAAFIVEGEADAVDLVAGLEVRMQQLGVRVGLVSTIHGHRVGVGADQSSREIDPTLPDRALLI